MPILTHAPAHPHTHRLQVEFFNSEGKPGILFDMWDDNRAKYEELAMKTFVHAEPILAENVEALEPMGSTNILKSMGKYMQRAAIQHARASDLFIFDMILVMGCGLFLGFSYGVWTLPKLGQNHLFYSLGLALTIGLASLRPFGAERIVFWREVSPGAGMNLNPLPYFLAKNLVEIPRLIILTMLFASCFFPQVKPLCNYFEFCGKSIMMSWYVAGIAQVFSISQDDKSAQLIMVVLCLVMLLYAGVSKPLRDMGKAEQTIAFFSPMRWLVEDLFVCTAYQMSPIFRFPTTWYKSGGDSLVALLYQFQYTEVFYYENWPAWNTIMTFWFGVVARSVAFVALNIANREKMGLSTYTAEFMEVS